jgi:hypothetical protein
MIPNVSVITAIDLPMSCMNCTPDRFFVYRDGLRSARLAPILFSIAQKP